MVRPWKAFSITRICGWATCLWWPYSRASFNAASFASAPELQKKAFHPRQCGHRDARPVALPVNAKHVGGVQQRAEGLLGDDLGDFRVRMPEAGHGDAGNGVQVFDALLVPEARAAPPV